MYEHYLVAYVHKWNCCGSCQWCLLCALTQGFNTRGEAQGGICTVGSQYNSHLKAGLWEGLSLPITQTKCSLVEQPDDLYAEKRRLSNWRFSSHSGDFFAAPLLSNLA
jgi:hypothetical protein